MGLPLFVNTSASSLANALVRSATDLTPVSMPQLVAGDVRSYDLYFVDGQGNYESFSGAGSYTPSVAIGACGNPSGGTFTLTFGVATTSALAYNISTAALQTALQALSTIGSGNAIVTGVAGQYYLVTFTGALANTNVAQISGDGTNLTPTSVVGVSTVTPGGGGANEVQLLQLVVNPIAYQPTWTPITNGWTGTLSTATMAVVQAMAVSGRINDTFQITLQDPSGNYRTYCQTPVEIDCTIINPANFAGANYPNLVTQAQLSAAVLGANNFTREAVTSSATGNTNITPSTTSRHHTANVTVTGTAGTRTLAVLTSNSPQAGDTVLINITPPATAGIVIEVRNATSGGTLIQSITTDGNARNYLVIIGYSGSAWALVHTDSIFLSASQNLKGLTNVATAKLNLATLFSADSSQSSNFTVTTANEGVLFRVSAAGGSVTATLPAASTAGAGFMVAIQKTDSSGFAVATSPATVSLVTQSRLVVLRSDGTSWGVILSYDPNASSPTALQTVQNWYFITTLAGNTGTSLDGQMTANSTVPTGAVVLIAIGSTPAAQTWQLRAGTTATGSGAQRPADYDASTNARVWYQIS